MQAGGRRPIKIACAVFTQWDHENSLQLKNNVLIEKKTMDEWRKQQEDLRLDMEKENNTVES